MGSEVSTDRREEAGRIEHRRPFRGYSRYLREKYGCRVYRVAVDGGFSCPNRGADRRMPGCTYCDERGARAPYLEGGTGDAGAPGLAAPADIERQVRLGVRFMRRRYGAERFLLYFQAFTGTNAPPGTLRRLYDRALALAPFDELIVSTRPDCVSEDVAALLAGYRRAGREVWVELGLQSACDATLRLIRRGHTAAEFEAAYTRLKRRPLKVAVHLIFGLPGESREDILRTVRTVAGLRPDGVKIHNLHVPVGTQMAEEYLRGELTVPSGPRHLDYTVSALEMLPADTVVMRLTCDTPPGRLAAPRGFWEKSVFYSRVEAEMRARATWQGRLFG